MRQNKAEKRIELRKILESVSPKLRFLPLSSAQLRSWEYQKADPESPYYNVALRVNLKGVLKVEILSKAFIELLKIHEALNTRFLDRPSGPIQFLAPFEETVLKVIDLRLLRPTQRGKIFSQIFRESTLMPIRLESDTIFSATLVRLSDQESELLICTHQIICDGISCYILLRDLQKLYQSLERKIGVEKKKLKNELFNYIEKQLSWSDKGTVHEQLSYWKEKLQSAPTEIKLPLNIAEISDKTPKSLKENFIVDSNDFSEIKKFCKSQGLTPFMFLLSAFSAALFKWTNQGDLVIGTLINNRSELDEETWKMAGEFTNFIVLRNQLDLATTGAELLYKVKQTVLDAHAHSTIPFEMMRDELNLERQKNSEPLYQMNSVNVDFIMHNMEFSTDMEFGLVKANPSMISTGVGDKINLVDLSFQLLLVGDELIVECQYNRGKVDPESVCELLKNFRDFSVSLTGNLSLRIYDHLGA